MGKSGARKALKRSSKKPGNGKKLSTKKSPAKKPAPKKVPAKKTGEDDLVKDKIAIESSDEEDDEDIEEIEKSIQNATKEPSKSVTSKEGAYTIRKPTGKTSSSADKSSKQTKRGVIYVGRLPHGFYEEELRKYFSQFGDISRLRLSRNRKTGKSKHYAFIEFKDSEAAQIAADTMNNYIVFEHVLKCSVIPPEKIHDELFVGANMKFKPIPWKKIGEMKNDGPKSEERWKQIEKSAEESIKMKQQKLNEEGIDFDISAI